MKIGYKKKRQNLNLFFGIAWGIFGTLTLFIEGKMRWTDYGYIVLSILYLGRYLYERANQYLTIENGTIRKNSWFGKKLALNEITWIKKFAGDYILKTDQQELTVNTDLIDEKSMTELNRILGNLELPSGKTPFVNITKRATS